jgi:hypothetical protein
MAIKKKSEVSPDESFSEYLRLDYMIKELEERKEALRDQLFGYVKTVGEREFEGFSFGTQSRKK